SPEHTAPMWPRPERSAGSGHRMRTHYYPAHPPEQRQAVAQARVLPGLPAAPGRHYPMPNKMLIDASHPEETRVVVVRGNRIEEFDFESENKKQLKGNIYLARVTRVEPSLQAAFV